jgi:enamine deaminase RidA (YjgF/YER057c/UK114 family)
MSVEIVLPAGWPRPKGYSNGTAAQGRLVFVAGQIGWNEKGEFPDPSFAGQFRQCLVNTITVLKAAGAFTGDVTRMTWYITDKAAYLASLKQIGEIWRELFGAHYPAMAVVVVSALIEDQALIEIETTAVMPDRG